RSLLDAMPFLNHSGRRCAAAQATLKPTAKAGGIIGLIKQSNGRTAATEKTPLTRLVYERTVRGARQTGHQFFEAGHVFRGNALYLQTRVFRVIQAEHITPLGNTCYKIRHAQWLIQKTTQRCIILRNPADLYNAD